MMKINRLEIENVKRIKAVKVEPAESGLTVIGGKNNQGKTSVLDSIAWALGGDRYRPTNAAREGSVIPPHLHIVMSNGLVVERKGKNSDLKITDPKGGKGGQQLLNEFVEQLAIDLPRFLQCTSREKADVLLQIIGVGDKLKELQQKETEVYNRRHAIGQIADQKEKFAKEMTYYPDAPKEPISAGDLIRQQQDILTQNGENARKRHHLSAISQRVEELNQRIGELQESLRVALDDLETAQKSAEGLRDESTEALEQNIMQIEKINVMVRANLDKDKAEEDALEYRKQYQQLTADLTDVRKDQMDLLANADLPLPGLAVLDGELVYNGKKWDGMSGSDQLMVSTAIVRRLNPQCGFVLLDKLEQMDLETLESFGHWLEQEGLQAIATRVSTGDECSIIIEDGYVKGREVPLEAESKIWKAGEF